MVSDTGREGVGVHSNQRSWMQSSVRESVGRVGLGVHSTLQNGKSSIFREARILGDTKIPSWAPSSTAHMQRKSSVVGATNSILLFVGAEQKHKNNDFVASKGTPANI